MNFLTDWLTQAEFFHNPPRLWLIAAAAALLGFLLTHTVLSVMGKRLRARQASAPNTARAVLAVLLATTRDWLLFLLAVVLASDLLDLPVRLIALLAHAAFALVGLQLALWANGLIALWLRETPDGTGRRLQLNTVLAGMLHWTLQLVVWTLLLMVLLGNMGVNVTALVASLGVGGVAVALALQNVLGDLFASMAIGLDKPFEVGQFIAFGAVRGTVTHVGAKSTRLDSLSGEQLIISNSDLLKQLVHNYSRMTERRVVFNFRLPYGTPRSVVEAVPPQVRSFIEADEKTRFDRGHLISFGEIGLEFEFVYYVLDPGYTLYCDIQQRVNLGIMDLLEDLGTEFAVPARQLRGPGTVAPATAVGGA